MDLAQLLTNGFGIVPILFGILKDLDGVDGLDGASSVTLSSDGNHAYMSPVLMRML